MSKSLLIVESPAKANTINKFLGKNFVVKSSVGHIRDLPIKKLGIDEEHDFAPQYTIMPGKQKTINELKAEAKKADFIYLAPDPDREGEAIAWHLFEVLGGNKKKIKRITFNEITKDAICASVKNPRDIDLNKVNSQQARRILDRLVGYKMSPLLWEKIAKGLSAGRVQSVAVMLICDREAQIEAFVSQEYWNIDAYLKKNKSASLTFVSNLFKINGKKAEVTEEKQAKKICEEAIKEKFIVSDIKKRSKKRNPYPPFITSTLQQAAVNKFHWSADRVMKVAQTLYEGLELGANGTTGLITYMRTDSFRIADEAKLETQKYIEKTYGKEYIPEKPNTYKSKKSAQEAHEAIRPTAINEHRTPDKLQQYLNKDQFMLYKLIWNRFIASQMEKATIFGTTILIEAGKYLFKTTGSQIVFPGFTLLYEEEKEEKEKIPELNEGDELFLKDLLPEQHFTSPPPRYTEASLIKTLEDKGIGRPSTYAPIIQTIVKREYVVREDRKFSPTMLGKVVTEMLVKAFKDIINVEFTAEMEDKLDKIESGKLDWIKVLKQFHTPFIKTLAIAKENVKSIKATTKETSLVCELCGSKMLIRWSRNGEFLACAGYPECKNTKEFKYTKKDEIAIVKPAQTNEICEKCGESMIVKRGRYGEFLACSGYPKCKNTKPIPTGIKCPNCDGELTKKRSLKGRFFFGCTNYPKCEFTARFLTKEQKEEAKMALENKTDVVETTQDENQTPITVGEATEMPRQTKQIKQPKPKQETKSTTTKKLKKNTSSAKTKTNKKKITTPKQTKTKTQKK